MQTQHPFHFLEAVVQIFAKIIGYCMAPPLHQELRHRELADWQKSIPKHVHVNVGTVYQ